ncbi:TolC family protein [Ferruginibacter sp. SUN106]|uniref:TolC family protein n=1 Tax=Ferruginibacter sp. SUN106 TaxID=2978348 RepID=UPI003D368591
MSHKLYTLLLVIVIGFQANAQQKWDLRKCVDYAMANNLTIKQTALQEKFSDLTLKQSKLSQYPTANFNNNLSYNYGFVQDAAFNKVNGGSLSYSPSLQSSVEIFNWFSKKNTIAANEWEAQAAKANTDKLKNDIALTVANFYLQVLLSKEQVHIAEVQLQQSQAQYSNTRKLVDAGSLPELNAAELEAQIAKDSATVITAKGNVTTNILSLKAYMSIDAAEPFEIETPPVDKIPVEKIADLQPEAVYTSALANLPQQRYNELKLKAAQKNRDAAKGSLYPTLSGFGSLNSGFNDKTYEFRGADTSIIPVPLPPKIGSVVVGGTTYDVRSLNTYTSVKAVVGKRSFFPQLDDNFRKSIGVSLSVPIFNGGSTRTALERSKLTIMNLELQKQVDNQKTKQDIYTAYNNALVALEKYNASKKSVETAERSFSFAQKRADVGMLSTFELITNQNNLFTQRLQNVLNQFDYVFKMKVLEFYKGQGLKL